MGLFRFWLTWRFREAVGRGAIDLQGRSDHWGWILSRQLLGNGIEGMWGMALLGT
jgi:hypothetical protein